MEKENQNKQSLGPDLKKTALLAVIILLILIVGSIVESRTGILTKLSGFLL